jgi:hypothetical protein
MMNITSWAAASAAMIAIFGACTTEVTSDNGDGGVTSTTASGGSGGTGGTTSTGGTGGDGTGGTGGSSDEGGTCSAPATPTVCETCAFAHCMAEVCACDAVTDCKGARGAYFTCLAGLDGGNMEACASDFVTQAGNAGSGPANELTGCIGDNNCEDACQGRDAGPRPRR